MPGARMTRQIPGDNYEFQRSQYRTASGESGVSGQSERFFVVRTKQPRAEKKRPQNPLAYHPKSQNYYSDSVNFLRSGQPDA